MQTTIQRVQFPDDRRILMISDLHGHTSGLRALLEEAGFSEQDVLVIVGDFVEKGPESLQTIRYVMELSRKHTVYPLMGNVDLWRVECLFSDDPAVQLDMVAYSLKALKWWSSSFLGELCEELGVALSMEMDTQAVFSRIRTHFEKELSFLSHLPTILETQRMIFVHGGIPHERLDELEGTPAHPLMKRDHFMEEGLSFQKYVVVGHWPVALYSQSHPCSNPVIDRTRHIISLDGGCGVKSDGQLNLLSIPCWQSEAFEYRTWNSLPVITALEAQEASADYGYIRWGDHQVEVLESMGDKARILHHGREMLVPSDFLWEDKGRIYCDDYTDYRLPVSPGDRLSLLRTLPNGCYVKKDGMTGWYMGRYQSE